MRCDKLMIGLALCLGAAGCAADVEFEEEVARSPKGAAVPQLLIDFRVAAHRAQVEEDGLEFDFLYPATNPRWAFYRVTSATPRLNFPDVLADGVDAHHWTQICGSAPGYMVEGAQLPSDTDVEVVLAGNEEGAPTDFRTVHASGAAWPACANEIDVRGGVGTSETITGVHLKLEPAPPIGAIVPLRMVAIGDKIEIHERPPVVCCDAPDDCTHTPLCGDGIKETSEVCDDGNNLDGDFCSADCSTIETPGTGGTCGDGDEDPGETCDDGVNNGNPGFCDDDCNGDTPYCGDGNQDPGEQCDDGLDNGKLTFCNASCSGDTVSEPGGNGSLCGDGTVDPGEACDDAANNGNPGFCDETCLRREPPEGGGPYCGDGDVNVGEVCDQGDVNGTSGYCSFNCTPGSEGPGRARAFCGDYFVDEGEECDTGADVGTDGVCETDCTLAKARDDNNNSGCHVRLAQPVSQGPYILLTIALGALIRRRQSR